MAKKERLKRDLAGIGPEPRRSGLKPLSSLKDYRIGKGEPDIRGWTVRTLNGREIGKVDDLLIDPDAGEVVMMDVEMRASERHVHLPLRHAQLDADANRVLVDSGDVDQYGALDDVPRYEERVDAEEELARTRRARTAEREELEPEARADADEVVVERRPVIEEVVIRRRVVDE